MKRSDRRRFFSLPFEPQEKFEVIAYATSLSMSRLTSTGFAKVDGIRARRKTSFALVCPSFIIYPMNCYILLADGFETTEALTTYDVLVRSHAIEPRLVSIHARYEVTSSHGVIVKAHLLLSEAKLENVDFLILPGGKKGVDNLKSSEDVHAFLLKAIEMGLHVHAICAAPSILGGIGYLDGKRYTCFPGFQVGKGEYTGDGVTVDGNLITGKSMGYSIPFAEAIVAKYCGEGVVMNIRKGTMGL